jgi:hypothetical protein
MSLLSDAHTAQALPRRLSAFSYSCVSPATVSARFPAATMFSFSQTAVQANEF